MQIELLKKDIQNIFDSGDWCTSVPKFQTWPTLFEIDAPHWLEIKNNFINEVSSYVGSFPKFVRAWCYANFSGHPQDNWPGWHTHPKVREDGTCLVCGVMYLTKEEQGTMFKNEEGITYASSDVGKWVFFDPETLHSPPQWDSSKKHNRYCIAAEAIY